MIRIIVTISLLFISTQNIAEEMGAFDGWAFVESSKSNHSFLLRGNKQRFSWKKNMMNLCMVNYGFLKNLSIKIMPLDADIFVFIKSSFVSALFINSLNNFCTLLKHFSSSYSKVTPILKTLLEFHI